MIFKDLRIKEIDCILHYTPQTLKFSSKNRTSYIIGIQLSGIAEHFLTDREFTLTENCIYFFNQNENYNVKIHEKGVAFSIHFTTYAPIEIKSFCIKISDCSNIVNLMNRIEHQFSLNSGCNTKTISDFYKLLNAFEEIYSRKYLPSNKKIIESKEYINLHFKEKDCTANAAKNYGVTKRRFNDIFNAYFNTTPNRYIVNCKISLAKELLKSGYLSVCEVAELSGFSDVYYFSKVFKTETGLNPTAYKKFFSISPNNDISSI